MPSPFPGMDPYLESPNWESFHCMFVSEIPRQLSMKVRPKYLAFSTERFGQDEFRGKAPHWSVELLSRADRRVVTVIECLSPAIKSGKTREAYLKYRRNLLFSSIHLLEIDIFHAGERLPMKHPLPVAPYYVVLSRSDKRPIVDVWPITLEQPLPIVPVPLSAGDSDTSLDLQLAFTTIYDAVSFDLSADYSKGPDVELPPNEAEWVDQRLREFRRRSDS